MPLYLGNTKLSGDPINNVSSETLFGTGSPADGHTIGSDTTYYGVVAENNLGQDELIMSFPHVYLPSGISSGWTIAVTIDGYTHTGTSNQSGGVGGVFAGSNNIGVIIGGTAADGTLSATEASDLRALGVTDSDVTIGNNLSNLRWFTADQIESMTVTTTGVGATTTEYFLNRVTIKGDLEIDGAGSLDLSGVAVDAVPVVNATQDGFDASNISSDGTNATITGDLQVDKKPNEGIATLQVDSTNKRIGVGITAPHTAIHSHVDSAAGDNYIQFTNDGTTSASNRGAYIGLDADENFVINNQETGKGVRLNNLSGTGTRGIGVNDNGDIVEHNDLDLSSLSTGSIPGVNAAKTNLVDSGMTYAQNLITIPHDLTVGVGIQGGTTPVSVGSFDIPAGTGLFPTSEGEIVFVNTPSSVRYNPSDLGVLDASVANPFLAADGLQIETYPTPANLATIRTRLGLPAGAGVFTPNGGRVALTQAANGATLVWRPSRITVTGVGLVRFLGTDANDTIEIGQYEYGTGTFSNSDTFTLEFLEAAPLNVLGDLEVHGSFIVDGETLDTNPAELGGTDQVQQGTDRLSMWTGVKADYDTIVTNGDLDANRLYNITDDSAAEPGDRINFANLANNTIPAVNTAGDAFTDSSITQAISAGLETTTTIGGHDLIATTANLINTSNEITPAQAVDPVGPDRARFLIQNAAATNPTHAIQRSTDISDWIPVGGTVPQTWDDITDTTVTVNTANLTVPYWISNEVLGSVSADVASHTSSTIVLTSAQTTELGIADQTFTDHVLQFSWFNSNGFTGETESFTFETISLATNAGAQTITVSPNTAVGSTSGTAFSAIGGVGTISISDLSILSSEGAFGSSAISHGETTGEGGTEVATTIGGTSIGLTATRITQDDQGDDTAFTVTNASQSGGFGEQRFLLRSEHSFSGGAVNRSDAIGNWIPTSGTVPSSWDNLATDSEVPQSGTVPSSWDDKQNTLPSVSEGETFDTPTTNFNTDASWYWGLHLGSQTTHLDGEVGLVVTSGFQEFSEGDPFPSPGGTTIQFWSGTPTGGTDYFVDGGTFPTGPETTGDFYAFYVDANNWIMLEIGAQQFHNQITRRLATVVASRGNIPAYQTTVQVGRVTSTWGQSLGNSLAVGTDLTVTGTTTLSLETVDADNNPTATNNYKFVIVPSGVTITTRDPNTIYLEL